MTNGSERSGRSKTRGGRNVAHSIEALDPVVEAHGAIDDWKDIYNFQETRVSW
jgi:hypothetical protein